MPRSPAPGPGGTVLCATRRALLEPAARERVEVLADLLARADRLLRLVVPGGDAAGVAAHVHRFRQRGVAVVTDPADALAGAGAALCVGYDAAEVVAPVARAATPPVAVVVDVGALDATSVGRQRSRAAAGDPERPFDGRFAAQFVRELNSCAAADGIVAADAGAAEVFTVLIGRGRLVDVVSGSGTAAARLAAVLDAAAATPSRGRPAQAGGAPGRSAPAGASKVFCIGLNKTGTTSLHLALGAMGLRSLHWGGEQAYLDVLRAKREGLRLLHHVGEGWDAYSDIETLSRNFDVADQQYPRSRFVLTVRDRDGWLDSRRRHVERNRAGKADGTYGGRYLKVEPEAWAIEWDEHVERVSAYFAHRPGDLLVLDVRADDAYQALGGFLGLDAPASPFPRANVDAARRATS